VRFQALTAASMKFRVFWDVAPCSLVEFSRRFRGTYCLHPQSDEYSSSETSVKFNETTRPYIPEDSKLKILKMFVIVIIPRFTERIRSVRLLLIESGCLIGFNDIVR
jgi:hypothetical protein